eukprot:749320-Rhodomonas_salina.2
MVDHVPLHHTTAPRNQTKEAAFLCHSSSKRPPPGPPRTPPSSAPPPPPLSSCPPPPSSAPARSAYALCQHPAPHSTRSKTDQYSTFRYNGQYCAA